MVSPSHYILIVFYSSIFFDDVYYNGISSTEHVSFRTWFLVPGFALFLSSPFQASSYEVLAFKWGPLTEVHVLGRYNQLM